MRLVFYKITLILWSFLTVMSCGGDKNPSTLFAIEIQGKPKELHWGDTIPVSIRAKSDVRVDKVSYSIDGKMLETVGESVILGITKLGDKELMAHIVSGDQQFKISKQIRVLSNITPVVYTYEIIAVYPHDDQAFTQGLEFYKDTLYEGTGKNGKSVLRKMDYVTGKVYAETTLDKAYFGEGITVMNDTVFQLTWQSGLGFLYDSDQLRRLGSFRYGKSAEGWGLCNDGAKLYKSDGSDKIWLLNPRTLEEMDHLQIVTNTSVFNKANELEYVDGKIYANVWQKESMMIINSMSGAIEGVVNFAGLKEQVTKHPRLDVFNGIAWSPTRKTFFVTGKYWDKLFEIVIKPRDNQ